MTASAPSGTTPPVAIAIASPDWSACTAGRPAAISSTTGSRPGVSSDLTANPSIAALAHPGITQVYDYGEAGGRPFMVLEYLPGGTLEERLEPDRPLPDEQTTRIATEMAAALAHAHERGLVHRDLKPANVLFDAQGHA